MVLCEQLYFQLVTTRGSMMQRKAKGRHIDINKTSHCTSVNHAKGVASAVRWKISGHISKYRRVSNRKKGQLLEGMGIWKEPVGFGSQ